MSAKSKLDALLGLLEPTVVGELDKQHTKARVLARVRTRRASIPRPAGVAALLVAGSAAAAGVQSIIDHRALDADSARPPRVVQGVPAPGRRTPPVRKQIAARPDGRAEVLPAPPHPAAEPRAPRGARAAPNLTPKPAISGDDPTRVAQALRALRKDDSPKTAELLLEQYLTDHPQGSLAEEALALSIEAAARQDPELAARRARRYLTGFPNGRFRDVARHALERAR